MCYSWTSTCRGVCGAHFCHGVRHTWISCGVGLTSTCLRIFFTSSCGGARRAGSLSTYTLHQPSLVRSTCSLVVRSTEAHMARMSWSFLAAEVSLVRGCCGEQDEGHWQPDGACADRPSFSSVRNTATQLTEECSLQCNIRIEALPLHTKEPSRFNSLSQRCCWNRCFHCCPCAHCFEISFSACEWSFQLYVSAEARFELWIV